MNEPLLRIVVAFCSIGMGIWPLMQRCGCGCTTALEFAERVAHEQRCDACLFPDDSPLPSRRATLVRSFEAVPNFAIKNFSQDHSLVEEVFSSPFQGSRPGRSAFWEVVENLSPPQVPRHVMFCTILE